MSINSDTLRRLAALKLPDGALSEVLAIIADMQSGDEERKKKDRERKRKIHGNSEENPCNGNGNSVSSSPPKEKSPTPPKEITPTPSSLRSESNKPHARKSSLPEDAQPTEADKRISEESGLSPSEFRDEWRSFRDHHCSRGNLMKNWHLAWSTWIRNSKKFKSRAGPSNGISTAGQGRRFIPAI